MVVCTYFEKKIILPRLVNSNTKPYYVASHENFQSAHISFTRHEYNISELLTFYVVESDKLNLIVITFKTFSKYKHSHVIC